MKVIILGVVLLLIAVSGCISQTAFYGAEECQNFCITEGFNTGWCLQEREAVETMRNVGSCVIEYTSHCGREGLCNCYCSNEPSYMSVADLMGNPIYETEVEIRGRISLLGELFCPCFELTSGGMSVQAWYGLMVEDDGTEMPSVNMEGFENGDNVIVTGVLKRAGQYHNENDFWVKHVEKYNA